jgi:hypothetical protein
MKCPNCGKVFPAPGPELGGLARARSLSAHRRATIARRAALARWHRYATTSWPKDKTLGEVVHAQIVKRQKARLASEAAEGRRGK